MDQAEDRAPLRLLSGSGERAGRGESPVERRSVAAPPPPPERRPGRGLAAVIARVREDAAREPGAYLEQAEVPGGGE